MAEENDQRPQSSLFDSPSVEVCFSDEGRLFVPRSLFADFPGLKPAGIWPRRDMTLDDVTRDAGHVMFYHVLTGTYQSLKPQGANRQEKLVNELTTTVEVYNASRKYELPALQVTAKDEIRRLANVLPFPYVLNLLRHLRLSASATEPWLDEYVQSGLKSLFKNPAAFQEDPVLNAEDDGISFSNVILRNLANLLVNGMVPTRDENVSISTPPPELETIEEHSLPAWNDLVQKEMNVGSDHQSVAEQRKLLESEFEFVHGGVCDTDIPEPQAKPEDQPLSTEVQSPPAEEPKADVGAELPATVTDEPTPAPEAAPLEPSKAVDAQDVPSHAEQQPTVEAELEAEPKTVTEPVPETAAEPKAEVEPESAPATTPADVPATDAKPEAEPQAAPETPAPAAGKVEAAPEPVPSPSPSAPAEHSVFPASTKMVKKKIKKGLFGFDSGSNSCEDQAAERPPSLTRASTSTIRRIRFLGR